MQYTKPMIELVFEIRRRVNVHHKPGVKLANPDLLTELAGLFRASHDTITKALIKELLNLAGPEWSVLLSDNTQAKEGSHFLKMYRGQASLEAKPSSKNDTDQNTPPSGKVRYYRGARIA